jgi:hypothetical protein
MSRRNPMAITISPRFRAKLIIRFEDGTECEVGDVLYRPDIEVTTTHSYEIAYKYRWQCTRATCGKMCGVLCVEKDAAQR